jgi:NitT/TauT family transport system substrate-binding protein
MGGKMKEIIAFLLFLSATAHAETYKLGIISALIDVGSLIAKEKGYFQQQNIDVDVNTFGSTADATQAISVGAIDVLASGVGVAIFNARQRHIDLSIVAGAGNNSPGHAIVSLVLRRDLIDSGRYKTPADLKGLTLSTGIAAPTQWFAATLAQNAGTNPRDINFVALGIANTVANMAHKASDGGCVNEPFATQLVDKGDGVRVASIDQTFPGSPAGYLLYGTALSKNLDAGTRYMIAYIHGMRDYRDAFGPNHKDLEGVSAILAKYKIQITPATPSLGVPDDMAPSLAFIDQFLDWSVAMGNLRDRPDPAVLIDDRFRLAALKE